MYQQLQPAPGSQDPEAIDEDQEQLLAKPYQKAPTTGIKILATICASQLVVTIILVVRTWTTSWCALGDLRTSSPTWGTGAATEYWQLRGNVRTVQKGFVSPIRPNYTAGTWDIEYAEGQRRYTGPQSDEIEQSWSDLMAAINFNVSGELSPPVQEQTFHYPDGQYLLGLEVFHGLHCVNIIRRTVSTGDIHASSTMDNELWAKHVWHCLDYLRQYVQCNADLTPMFFEYIGRSSAHHDHSRNLALRKGTAHACADFEGIHSWVMDRIHQD